MPSLFRRAFQRGWVPIALLCVYVYAFPYFAGLRHANELPRILTTTQIVDHGTLRLDDCVDRLGSRADVSTTPDGHVYQNKAPGLAFLAVPIYGPLSFGFGLAGRTPPAALTTWLFRVLVVTVPTVLFFATFRRVSQRFAESEEARNGGLVAVALGSMLLPYGMMFMSHALAASLVGFAFALAIRCTRDPGPISEPRGALGVGALLGLAMLTEYQAVFGAIVVAGYFLWGARTRLRVAASLFAGTVPFLVALALYHQAAFGSPFRTGYAYSVDTDNRVGFMGIVGVSATSVRQLLVSTDNGLLLLSPWVLLAVVGGIAIARNGAWRARVGREALASALIVVAYAVFVASLAPSFGRAGWSVGPRYLAVAVPFFAWLAAAGLEVCLGYSALRIPGIALVLVGVGVHVLAATTYPHWPSMFANPLFEISVRLLREGYVPRSLGTWIGLRGLASLVPLYVGVLVVVVRLLAPGRRMLLEVGMGVVLATFIVVRYERLAVTKDPDVATWNFVLGTFEP